MPTFVIFHDQKLLVTLTNINSLCIAPLPTEVLDWYAKHYAFERSKLSGYWCHSIDVKDMKYEDFINS